MAFDPAATAAQDHIDFAGGNLEQALYVARLDLDTKNEALRKASRKRDFLPWVSTEYQASRIAWRAVGLLETRLFERDHQGHNHAEGRDASTCRVCTAGGAR